VAARGARESTGNDRESAGPKIENPGYLGPQACRPCHAERVAEFLTTNHARTFRVPEEQAMPPGFAPGHGAINLDKPGLRFEMTRTRSGYFQTAIHATPQGEKRTTSRVDFILGAGGKADEVYLTWHGERLYELPVAWLFSSDEWGISHFAFNGSSEGSRNLTVRCLECHNTWFAHVPGTLNQYKRDSFIMGVTCEKCHGPGREHVAFHQAHSEAGSGEAILNPARLKRERLLEVCTQCHGNATVHRGPALQYRPGEPLDAYYKILEAPRHTEDDHVANQIKYLRQSKCFQESEMTCTTCHNPHRRPASSGIDSCLKCHASGDCRERDRLPSAVRSQCVACHMPSYIKININFETEDDDYVPPIQRCDHRIAVHPRARDEILLSWNRERSDPDSKAEAARLTRSLVEDWLNGAESCLRDFRILGAIAAYREAYRLEPAPATREKMRQAIAIKVRIDRDLRTSGRLIEEHRYQEAVDLLEALLPLKPDHPKIQNDLGLAYASMGKKEQAIPHLRLVTKYDPDDPSGVVREAWLAYVDDRAEDAAELYRQADEIAPFIAKINYPWGLALEKLERWDEAARRFRHVLEIDPNHAGGHLGLADALRREGRPAEALPHARRAARLTEFQDAHVLLTLIDTCIDLERFAEAETAASKALDASQATSPQLSATIRQRLTAVRARRR
jgi:tetratricopeptide (TPR) repeat protein